MDTMYIIMLLQNTKNEKVLKKVQYIIHRKSQGGAILPKLSKQFDNRFRVRI